MVIISAILNKMFPPFSFLPVERVSANNDVAASVFGMAVLAWAVIGDNVANMASTVTTQIIQRFSISFFPSVLDFSS